MITANGQWSIDIVFSKDSARHICGIAFSADTAYDLQQEMRNHEMTHANSDIWTIPADDDAQNAINDIEHIINGDTFYSDGVIKRIYPDFPTFDALPSLSMMLAQSIRDNDTELTLSLCDTAQALNELVDTGAYGKVDNADSPNRVLGYTFPRYRTFNICNACIVTCDFNDAIERPIFADCDPESDIVCDRCSTVIVNAIDPMDELFDEQARLDNAFGVWCENTRLWYAHAPTTVHNDCVTCDYYCDRTVVTRKAYFDAKYVWERSLSARFNI